MMRGVMRVVCLSGDPREEKKGENNLLRFPDFTLESCFHFCHFMYQVTRVHPNPGVFGLV